MIDVAVLPPHHPRMDRRRFLLTSLAGALVVPLGAGAQQAGRVARIGFLTQLSPSTAAPHLEAFRQGLRDLGHVEGKNIVIETRYESRNDRLADVLAELIRLRVDAIVAWGTPAGRAAKNATTTIPIISFSIDPVRTGLVASLARPGGNITGVASFHSDLTPKRLELLREVVPKLSRLFVIWNPDNPGTALDWRETQATARALAVKLQPFEVRHRDELEDAFRAIPRERGAVRLVLHDVIVFDNLARITEFGLKNQLPTVFSVREYVDAGGLLSYGVNFPDLWRRMAPLVDKVLKGARPADLPVEQPTKYELVINLKTAKALGLTIPPSLLLRADQVIE